MTIKLIVDDREHLVIPYFKEYNNVEIEVKRIQIGDYVITQTINDVEKILFCIERKSWVDLSSSIKDGRTENVNKMIHLREQTGCKLLYLMEGKTRYPSSKKFSRIPYKNLQAKLDHLIIRDNIFVIHSNDQEDTVLRLIEFITNFLSLDTKKSVTKPLSALCCINSVLESAVLESAVLENSVLESAVLENAILEGAVLESAVLESAIEKEVNVIGGTKLLTQTIQKTDLQIIYNLWETIPNITSKTASLFIDAGYHISDLVLGLIDKDTISTMRYTNGTIIGKRADKIIKVKDNNQKVYCNMLAELPMITKKTAALILLDTTFNDLLRGGLSLEKLSNIKKTPKARIGVAAATAIYKFLIKIR